MKKGTPEQITQKREEINNACEQLYQTMRFREITFKKIGEITSFSRPTIYNYFETKEEIAAIITHATMYVGWPKGWAVFRLAKEVWNEE